MRKIKIVEHISLDGVIAPGGRHADTEFAHGGWTAPYRTAAGAEMVADAYGAYDLILGRLTYDLWAGFWPKVKGGPFADRLNSAKKYVATHRPDSLEWGPAEGVGPDLVAGVRRVMSTDGPDLLVNGSGTVTSVLLENGLVDEVVLCVYPVLLGPGKRFFSDRAEPRELALVSTKASPSGVLVNTYRHVGSMRTESAPATS